MGTGEEFIAALRRGDFVRCHELAGEAPELLHAPIDGVSPVLAARYHGHAELALELLRLRGAPDLYEAAALGEVDALQALLAEGAHPVDAPGADGHRALGLAAFFGQAEAVRLLLEAGARPDAAAENAMRVSSLHAAVAGGDVACVRAVLEAGASPHARQQGGWTPLHAAAQRGHEGMIAALLELGADPHARNDDGATPADEARKAGHEPIAKWLEMQPP